jgi:hypothetical protein
VADITARVLAQKMSETTASGCWWKTVERQGISLQAKSESGMDMRCFS